MTFLDAALNHLNKMFFSDGAMHAGALLMFTITIPFFSLVAIYSNIKTSNNRLALIEKTFPTLVNTTFYRLFVDGARKTRASRYVIPVLFLTLINYFMSMILLDGGGWTDKPIATTRKIFLLCGDHCWEPDTDVSLYQTQTVSILSYAFLGWTVWTLTAIFDRASSHHIFPATFNRLILRLMVAMMIAATARHLSHGMIPAEQLTGVVLAFCVGMFPERGLKWITDKFDKMVRPSDRSEDFDLEWIEGVDGVLTFRLRELSVGSAADLAVANPFSIAEAIAQPLSAVVDWIAQAQLLVLLKSDRMKKLRNCGIRTIFDLVGVLESDGGRAYLKAQCGWDILEGYDPADAIQSDGEYKRLLEVYVALGSDAPGKKQPPLTQAP